MTTPPELLSVSRPSSVSLDGTREEYRTWRVATAYPIAAREADGIPKCGNPNPDDPSLICHNVTTAPTGNASTDVTAKYSTQAFSLFRRLSIPTRYQWGWGSRVEVLKFVLNILDYIQPPGGAVSPDSLIPVWTLGGPDQNQVFQHRESRVERPITITYTPPGNGTVADFDPIDAQRDKLHLLGGKYYRFCPPQTCVRPINATTWELTYAWELDKGTNLPNAGPYRDNIGVYLVVPADARAGLLRNPYSTHAYVRPKNPTQIISPAGNSIGPVLAGMFDTVSFYPYQIDELGWLTLPGVPHDLG